MSRRIFRAGLKHSLVDAKWPAFEEVFRSFDLRRVRAMNDEETEALMNDRRVIRHWGKIKAVRSFVDFALFVAFFPQLVAGPIVRAVEFLPQMATPPRVTMKARRAPSGVH